MEVHSTAVFNYDRIMTETINPRHPQTMSALKARQCAKIQEIVDALEASGFVSLNQQARVLGLGRSTTWSVLQNHYKNTGLSAKTINHILSSSRLPPRVRVLVIEYVEEKMAGRYGHNHVRRRRFTTQLTPMLAESGHLENFAA